MGKTKKEKVDKDLTPVPPKYPKEVKSYLTVLMPGGGSKVIKVKEISSELIQLPDKTELYTGVPPDIQAFQEKKLKITQWRHRRMHYAIFGMPYTYNPRNNQFFDSEKKKAILIERGYVIPIQVSSTLIIGVMIDYEQEKPTPLWREEKLDKFPELKTQYDAAVDKGEILDFITLSKWIQDHIEELSALQYKEYPFFTPEDVSSIDMMRAETFQLQESKGIQTAIKALSKIGEGIDATKMMLILGGVVIGQYLITMYFANEGVFGAILIPLMVALSSLAPRRLDPVDEAVGNAINVLVDPTDAQARGTAHINALVPVCVSVLLAYEKRLNELLGICETIGRPLYKPMTFFTDIAREFAHWTPSVASRRADKLLEAFGQSGALQRVPDFGPVGATYNNPFLQRTPPERVDGKGKVQKIKEKIAS